MQLLKQPNFWSCLPTSFAMALDISINDIFKVIGHDGSEIIWPQQPEPLRRRSFHIQEMISVAYSLQYAVIGFEALPVITPEEGGPEHLIEFDFEGILYNCRRGVLTGISSSHSRHAVAWNGSTIYDPNGTKYSVEEFSIETLWAVEKISHG